MPDAKTATAEIGHNKPPLDVVAKSDIDEQLAPFKARFGELMDALGRAKCDTISNAGKCADLVKQFKKLRQKIDSVRKDVKEPYAEAVKVIDAAPKLWFNDIDDADRKLRSMMAEFDRAEQRREAAERAAAAKIEREKREKEAAEQRRIAAERAAAEAAGAKVPEPEPDPEPEAPVQAPEPTKPTSRIQGDYGAAAHRRVTKVPVIEDVYALPLSVLDAPDVHEAILKVVRRMRTANPEIVIKGIRIDDQSTLMVR